MRLYLVAPGDLAPADMAAALDAGEIGCVRLTTPNSALRDLVQARDIACLVEGKLAAGYDGVHRQETFEKVAGDLIVGVDCGASRHLALEAAEAGAGYIASADADLLTWWGEMMEVPCVGEGAETPAAASALARLGVDFVSAGDAIWRHPEGPAAGVRAFNAAIAGNPTG